MELTPAALMSVVDIDDTLVAHVPTAAHLPAPSAVAMLTNDGDDTDRGRAFFASRVYTCKDDIIAAVVEYNYVRRRAYKVMTSDRRRYQVRCVDTACPFLVSFAFSTSFKPPTRFRAHTCSAITTVATAAPVAAASSDADADALDATSSAVSGSGATAATTTSSTVTTAALVSSRACRAKQIARYPEVRALVVAHGAHVKAAWIKDLLMRNGLTPTYANCFHARRRLLQEFAEKPHAFIAQQQQQQSRSGGHLLSLATFAAAPALAPSTGSGLESSDAAAAAGTAASGLTLAATAAAATMVSAPNKRQRTLDSVASSGIECDDSALPSSLPLASLATSVNAEPVGCCFVSPSVAVTALEPQQLLQWHVRDPARVKTFFDLYDGNRRIEILRSGTYRLHLYIEPVARTAAAAAAERIADATDAVDSSGVMEQDDDVVRNGNGDVGDVGDSDDAVYHLLVNNAPLSVFQHHSDIGADGNGDNGDDSGDGDGGNAAAVPTCVFHVAEVALQKWDMLVLRRSRQLHANSSSSRSDDDNVHTAFARFIIELV